MSKEQTTVIRNYNSMLDLLRLVDKALEGDRSRFELWMQVRQLILDIEEE